MDQKNNTNFHIKSMEHSNLFQRRVLHADSSSHNYDFVGGEHDNEDDSKTHKSNTNTLKNAADNNDNNNLKLNNVRQMKNYSPGVGSEQKMESQMGKSVKFEIKNGSVDSLKVNL